MPTKTLGGLSPIFQSFAPLRATFRADRAKKGQKKLTLSGSSGAPGEISGGLDPPPEIASRGASNAFFALSQASEGKNFEKWASDPPGSRWAFDRFCS